MPFQKQVVAADVMVMPRSCSCSIQSIVGRAVVDFTDLVVHAGVVQDALGRGGLAGVDVRGNADVAVPLNGGLTSHVTPDRQKPQTAIEAGRGIQSGS